MIKKCGILLLIVILTLGILIPLKNVYAIDSFFEIEEKEVSKGSNIELTIHLDKIVYDKFKFELVSDEQLIDISTDEDITVEKNDNEIYIEMAKQVTSLKQVILIYPVPENKNIGDIITFVASVKNLEDETQSQVEQVQVTIIENKSEETPSEPDKEDGEQPKEPERTENQKPNEQENSNTQNRNEMVENSSDKMNFNMTNDAVQTTKNVSIQGMNTKQQSSTTETVTYHGSNNNYLSSLSVEGYELNRTFCKDNSTYFLDINNDISSIHILTEKEDDTATVCVYGNEELKEGMNKILVNVTAENGNVRTYRIYVKVEA